MAKACTAVTGGVRTAAIWKREVVAGAGAEQLQRALDGGPAADIRRPRPPTRSVAESLDDNSKSFQAQEVGQLLCDDRRQTSETDSPPNLHTAGARLLHSIVMLLSLHCRQIHCICKQVEHGAMAHREQWPIGAEAPRAAQGLEHRPKAPAVKAQVSHEEAQPLVRILVRVGRLLQSCPRLQQLSQQRRRCSQSQAALFVSPHACEQNHAERPLRQQGVFPWRWLAKCHDTSYGAKTRRQGAPRRAATRLKTPGKNAALERCASEREEGATGWELSTHQVLSWLPACFTQLLPSACSAASVTTPGGSNSHRRASVAAKAAWWAWSWACCRPTHRFRSARSDSSNRRSWTERDVAQLATIPGSEDAAWRGAPAAARACRPLASRAWRTHSCSSSKQPAASSAIEATCAEANKGAGSEAASRTGGGEARLFLNAACAFPAP